MDVTGTALDAQRRHPLLAAFRDCNVRQISVFDQRTAWATFLSRVI